MGLVKRLLTFSLFHILKEDCVAHIITDNLTLSYTGGDGFHHFLLLFRLVLNSVSGIQAIVLMFGDFS